MTDRAQVLEHAATLAAAVTAWLDGLPATRPADDRLYPADRYLAQLGTAARIAADIDVAAKRATDWREGPAAPVDASPISGDPERSTPADGMSYNPTSRVWTARRRDDTTLALAKLNDLVDGHRDTTQRLRSHTLTIVAAPNPDALGRQSQLVDCANRHCDTTIDPLEAKPVDGRCHPCATFRRTNNRDRTAREIREANGNVGAGRCEADDCDVICSGDPRTRLRTHPTTGAKVCDLHYKRAIRANA